MSKKHFQAIASILANESTQTKQDIARMLANYFAIENPRFDRARFLAACGLEND